VVKRRSQTPTVPGDTEYQRFAEEFTDLILDPRSGAWIIQFLLQGGFEDVPSEEYIESGGFAQHVLNLAEMDWVQPTWLVEALYGGDRERVSLWVKERLVEMNVTSEDMKRFLTVAHPSFLRKSLKQLGAKFKFHRGPRPKLPPREYSKILGRAEVLRPAIVQLLSLLPGTKNSLSETLKYLQKDYPEACEFLLRHQLRFEKALGDAKLLKRAESRIPARARVLADAMAGTDYDLRFSTSVERVREARRRVTPKTS
jgi:hypothetical protein